MDCVEEIGRIRGTGEWTVWKWIELGWERLQDRKTGELIANGVEPQPMEKICGRVI